ncbi:MAG: NAD-dependent epimerase/dehydratase family protein [Caldilineales bacterium]|nr:NAD-dependent epimerase/dehydratase family protein [Caldilineales bacterium]MCW5856742.1 NAD-dependent epimerase/dehydratase family protein [Caldilineales bacterium]
MNILVTGSKGFIGSNLLVWLRKMPDYRVFEFNQKNTQEELTRSLNETDYIIHLAGINRPQSVDEFTTGNVDLTARICQHLIALGRPTPILLSSSIQVDLDNPYGVSKRQAEQVLADYAARSGAAVTIFRLSNVFGKWCRPNYNSVVATFCHNIAHDLPITISDPAREVPLVYVDDVVEAFLAEVRSQESGVRDQRSEVRYQEARPIYTVTLGRLAELIRSFRESHHSLVVPDFSDPFVRKLYGTFLSYLEPGDFAYNLTQRTDNRGALAEFVKSPPFGQIFVSRTKPGITRGNHFHHTKTEKFLVLEGEAIIRFRDIRGRRSEVSGQESEVRDQESSEVIEYRVSGQDFRVVDIPTGYTHSIENVGPGELVTLFWASEVFDPGRPDTVWEEVL